MTIATLVDDAVLAEFFTHAGRQIALGCERVEREFGDVEITVTVQPDPDSNPDEFDCYSPEQIAAWKRDDWWYQIMKVEVSVGGVSAEHLVGGYDHSLTDTDVEAAYMATEVRNLYDAAVAELPAAAQAALAEARKRTEAARRILAA